MTIQDILIREIESQRALLQTYLASDMDIDKMDYYKIINYAFSDIKNHVEFLVYWKDYAFLRGKLNGYLISKQETLKSVREIIDKWANEDNGYPEISKGDIKLLKLKLEKLD